MKNAIIFLLIVTILVTTVACQKEETSPQAGTNEPEGFVEDNNAFAIELYNAISEDNNSNILFSPYSISEALAMTYAGARGQTEQQMAEVLHFKLSQDTLHQEFSNTDKKLKSRGKEAEGKDDEGFRLNVANAIWGQKGYDFLADFLNTLSENYGAGLNTLDFANKTEESRVTINDWISEKTEDRIKDMIPPGALSPLSRLVLTNAIYFNAAWEHQFSAGSITDRTFYLPDENEILVPMMKQTKNFNYTEEDNCQVVELPYDGNEVSMVIMLPGEGEFKSFEAALDAEKLDDIISDLEEKRVTLTMPKFKFESRFRLSDTLSAMGMADAFSANADFSGISTEPGLSIDQVLHRAFIDVDENGTEAAAATAVIVVGAAPGKPPEPVIMTIDRPFIFLIRDIETGTILFLGRVVNPDA